MSKYCIRVIDVVNEIVILGKRLGKEVIVKKVMKILTTRWNHVGIINEESKDLNSLEFDSLLCSLVTRRFIETHL